ncbi:hypothetical protein [Pseudomonas sp. CGJS7]|uniref:hypothetical protein n=1 Tax=Pseudomonas sp. CGJS7 TaxID=3109348 RepID=UPI003008430C
MRPSPMLSPLLLALALSACQSGDESAEPQAAAGATAAPAAPAAPADPKQTAERAFAELRKTEPKFERLGYSHLVGDIDGDGRDDVAIAYGEGTEDATMAANMRLAVLLTREQGPQLLPSAQMPDFCVFLRKIESGKLYIDSPDICTAARPKIADYYTYRWDGKALVEAAHETREQRIMSGLRTLAKAFAGNDKAGMLAALKFPMDAGSVPVYDTALGKAAEANGGKIDRAMAERHFADLLPPERVAEFGLILSQVQDLKPVAGDSGTLNAGAKRKKGDLDEWFTLSIDLDPEEDRFEDNQEIIDARIDLEGGTGKNIEVTGQTLGEVLDREQASQMYQSMRLFLIDGEMRLVIPNAAG